MLDLIRTKTTSPPAPTSPKINDCDTVTPHFSENTDLYRTNHPSHAAGKKKFPFTSVDLPCRAFCNWRGSCYDPATPAPKGRVPTPIMSDPQNSRTPQGSNRPGEPTGFNWKLIGLLSVALLILGIAVVNPNGFNGRTTELSYPEFREAWDQGRVITKDQKKFPFKVVTKDSPYTAVISGWLSPQMKAPSTPETDSYKFKVPVNLLAQADALKSLLGENVPTREVSGTPAVLTPPSVTPNPAEADTTRILSLAEFRKARALGEIKADDANNPLTLAVNPGSFSGNITGFRSEVKNRVPEPVDGKVDPRPFEVVTSVPLLGDDLTGLIKGSGTSFVQDSDMLKGAIFTFLPVLLVVLLLIFLFRQQMKAAGRGAMSFGKSKARLLTMDRNKVTFKDVAGIEEAKEEVSEIVEFLRDPGSSRNSAARFPRAC